MKTQFFSMLTLAICLIYMIYERKKLLVLIRQRVFRLWLSIIWILPIAFSFIHVELNNLLLTDFSYYAAIISLNGSLFCVSSIISAKDGSNKKIKILFVLMTIAAIIGIILSFVNYQFMHNLNSTIENVKVYDNVTVKDEKSGFFLNKNELAHSLVFYYTFIIIFIGKYRRFLFNFIIFAVFTLSIFFTGSRTSFFIFLLINICYFLYLCKNKIHSIILSISFFLILGGIIGYLISNNPTIYNLYNRFSNLNDDASLSARHFALIQYAEAISDNLIIGKGPTYRIQMKEKGIFTNVAQNEFVETTMTFGIFATLFFVIVLIYTFVTINKSLKSDCRSMIKIIIILFVIYGFSFSLMFLMKLNNVILGLLFGMYYRDCHRIFFRIHK
jgi:hypothetical protein